MGAVQPGGRSQSMTTSPCEAEDVSWAFRNMGPARHCVRWPVLAMPGRPMSVGVPLAVRCRVLSVREPRPVGNNRGRRRRHQPVADRARTRPRRAARAVRLVCSAADRRELDVLGPVHSDTGHGQAPGFFLAPPKLTHIESELLSRGFETRRPYTPYSLATGSSATSSCGIWPALSSSPEPV